MRVRIKTRVVKRSMSATSSAIIRGKIFKCFPSGLLQTQLQATDFGNLRV